MEERDISMVVDSILRDAIAKGASDIHVEPYKDVLHVRFRIDGSLLTYKDFPISEMPSITTKIKLLWGMKIDENRLPQDGRYTIQFDEHSQVEFRISSIPTLYGETIVLRILQSESELLDIEKIGFLDYHMDIIKSIPNMSYGIILITGPTGSGKTTSLYSILKLFDIEQDNIVTLEDPCEYRLKWVNQTQINHDIGLTFASGLRTILRQDPDIIMVGEIRDKETASLATEAALTWHLVLSTIHTNSAAATPQRLMNMGIEGYLIGASLRLVISQRLIKRVCPHCQEITTVSDEVKHKAFSEIEHIIETKEENIQFVHGTGCQECNFTGYKGRIPVYEVLSMDDHLEQLICERADVQELQNYLKQKHFVSMKQDAILKAMLGITSLEQALLIE